jgi:hypothetical protein
VIEVDYAEYVTVEGAPGPSDYVFAVPPGLLGQWIAWPGMSVVIPAGGPYQVEAFVPNVQSVRMDQQRLRIDIARVVAGGTTPPESVGSLACTSLPNDQSPPLHKQTFGPLVYSRRFDGFLGPDRMYTVRYQSSTAEFPWVGMLQNAGPNAAYIRADRF